MAQPKIMKNDRLSLLPDTILIHIISFLPIKSAVITSVLSHQWRYLWTHITNVVFTPTCLPSRRYNSSAPLIFPKLPFPKVNSFYLCLSRDFYDFSNAESWIRDLCTRNPEQIVVESNLPTNISTSTCFFQCQSLVVLMLTKNIFIRPPAGGFVVNLPKLKKLQLSGYWDDALATIIRGCPLLEDLNLVITSHGNCYMFVHLLDLSAHYIKKLVIIRAYDYNVIPTYQLVVNLSKLEEMTLHIPFGLANIRFVGYSSALISAEFRFPKKINFGKEINYLSRIAGLAQLISEVRSLKIDNYALEAVCSLENEVVLGMYYGYCEIPSCGWSWNDVVLLLQCCPSLEVLKVEISRYLTKRDALEHWPSCCSPCWSRLKRIKIRYISESDADF
ncbi:FBD-associated F-box protein At4g10400-like [Chenopodium quinoa]|uniref:FBD-associated F-box protein At4g10400-like n=1 Tax=Chenopodium quinoa TaxID=63459 RepID=UPI000B773223|nr:FBD-associated F-box protein At4g10400-like [Chenopodium quinoa]